MFGFRKEHRGAIMNTDNTEKKPTLFVPTSSAITSRGGGQAPQHRDSLRIGKDEEVAWEDIARPSEPNEARLIILQITDVYTLEHFASFKTLLEQTRERCKGAVVRCVLTGDFLAPYLLSSIDRGAGMMQALARVSMDYLTWGNHEADIEHRTVCRHVRGFSGKWINSNMLDHEAMDAQDEYDILEIESPDGSQQRKVGLMGVLSNDPSLYNQFPSPGAFGGATITDPWECLAKYKSMLEGPEHGCDLVIPLEHLYVPDDYKTCLDFDFPVVLSGHDHHRVDEVVAGTRLLKPGMNAVYSTVLEVSWQGEGSISSEPKIRACFVENSNWPANQVDAEANERAYDALLPLRNTELDPVAKSFQPLSSGNSRGEVCTMGKFICTMIRTAMNSSRRFQANRDQQVVDAVLLMGGNIRGNAEYPPGSFFSLEALEAEVKADETVAVVQMPGWLLAEGVAATHAGDPIPGWMQYDDGVVQDTTQHPPRVTHVGGKPLENDRAYLVATKISDLINGQSPPWTEYYKKHPETLPPKGAYVNVQSELLSYFARSLWRKIWKSISDKLGGENCGLDEPARDCMIDDHLEKLDANHDGEISVEEIQEALREHLGFVVDDSEKTLGKFIHSFADLSGDGKVKHKDLEIFCEEILDLYD